VLCGGLPILVYRAVHVSVVVICVKAAVVQQRTIGVVLYGWLHAVCSMHALRTNSLSVRHLMTHLTQTPDEVVQRLRCPLPTLLLPLGALLPLLLCGSHLLATTADSLCQEQWLTCCCCCCATGCAVAAAVPCEPPAGGPPHGACSWLAAAAV
jgi:hypothetical protein